MNTLHRNYQNGVDYVIISHGLDFRSRNIGQQTSPIANDPMSQNYIPFLDDPTSREPGDLDEFERWWVERQEALERAGYMLRPRFRPGWQPSWAGTGKPYYDFEDGQPMKVSLNSTAHPG